MGTGSSVLKYNASLTLLSTYAVGNPVYDVKIGSAGEILAGGTNFLASINLSSCDSPCLPLAVKFEGFSVNVSENDVLVRWKLSDLNGAYSVSVEKSTDGVSFNKIAVNCITNEHIDKNAEKNKILYYRIVATDKDGHSIYSNVLSAIITDNTNKIISLYPNPLSQGSMLNIDYYGTAAQSMPVRIIDALGKTIMQNTVTIYPGINHIELNLNHLNKGRYWVIIGNNQKQSFVVSE